MRTPEPRFATTADGAEIAYQVVGTGDVDIVLSLDWVTHCEAMWEFPPFAQWYERLARLGRIIMFDKRGIGMSERVSAGDVPSLQTWVDDLRAVLDEVGAQKPVLFAMGHGAQLALLFAATFPQRCDGLILLNAYARLGRSDDYPIGVPPAVQDYVVKKLHDEWGRTGWVVDFLLPSRADHPAIKDWYRRMERLSCTPGAAAVLQRTTYEQDVRDVLPTIQAPTLVMHSNRDMHVHVEHGRYLARHIPGARYVELDSPDQWATLDAVGSQVIAEASAFLGARPLAVDSDRVLATLVFTDLVDSTPLVQEHGDHAWRQLLDQLDALARDRVAAFRGRVVAWTGDGHLATFDGAARAVRCAEALVDEARAIGLQLRAGVHTGEVELRGDDVAGIAVHVAQRVCAAAGAGEVLVSSTVHDLVTGSDIAFADRGDHLLKGVGDPRRLFAVAG